MGSGMISRLRTCFFEGNGHVGQDHQIVDALVFEGRDFAMSALLVRNCSAHCEGTVTTNHIAAQRAVW